MAVFTANGSDILNNTQVSVSGVGGQDDAGQATINGGTQIFSSNHIVEFEAINVGSNGEFSNTTKIVGIKVYATSADYVAGNALYTYGPRNPGESAQVNDSADRMGDTYVRVATNALKSDDPGAPSVTDLFVAPGSNVALNAPGPTTFDHHGDVDYNDDGSINQSNEENGNGFFNTQNSTPVCLTKGALVLTETGSRPVETLRVGDLIQTKDNGLQPLVWQARRSIGRFEMVTNSRFCPVAIKSGHYGATRDVLVSRQHAVLDGDNLVRAIDLTRKPKGGARIARGQQRVVYYHLMFEAHQLICSDGMWSESFYPGPVAQQNLTPEALNSLHCAHPDLPGPQSGMAEVFKKYGSLVRPFEKKPRELVTG